jgi:hypothetical protein
MNLSQKKPATKGGLRSIAAFLAPALIGLVVVGAVIAWKQELFVTRTPIYIFTDSALGITKGIPVKVFGLTVGTVDDIEIVAGTPGNKGQVRIRLNIGSEYLHHITKDSRAKLMREGVVGQALIEILPGDQNVRPVARNEVTHWHSVPSVVPYLARDGGADLSEQFEISTSADDLIAPGSIVCIDPERPGELRVSDRAYDPTVAGIISGAGGVKPGMLMGQRGTPADGQHPVALTGRVYCKVDASHGAIKPGDLITTSPTPGHGMRADSARASGAILGKAMTPLGEGRGLVLVLVSLQ